MRTTHNLPYSLQRGIKLIMLIILCACALNSNAQTKSLYIAHTSDTHSCIEPIAASHPDSMLADRGGFLRRAAMFEELRKEHPELLVLDCGDFSQGSVYYNLFHGDIELSLMNMMHYDACTLGNHEFDFGLENLARLVKNARFPFVCCNYDFKGTPCEGLIHPYTIIERCGLRIGVFGVCVNPEGLISEENYKPMRYIQPHVAAQPVIDRLRGEEHCDVVICLSHLGWEEVDYTDGMFISKVKGLDALLGGHSHSYFEEPAYVRDAEGHEVLVDHQGKSGIFVGLLQLSF